MSLILSIETATEVCSVAISDKTGLIGLKSIAEGMRHSQSLTNIIKQVIDGSPYTISELAAVAISDGPGSYTGLRVGASTAKSMCYALNIPMIAVSTLESLALDEKTNHAVLSAIDARRMEVYIGLFKEGCTLEETKSLIWSEETIGELAIKHKTLIITGTGVEKAAHLLNKYPNIRLHPKSCCASYINRIARKRFEENRFVDIAYHTPFYYKNPNITTSKKIF